MVDGGVVHWDWLHEVPMRHGVTFNAEQYDAQVARVAADHSWERPQDTTARLVIEGAEAAALADRGRRLSWAAADHRDPSLFVVSFMTTDNNFQVFVRVPRDGRDPDSVREGRSRPTQEAAFKVAGNLPLISAEGGGAAVDGGLALEARAHRDSVKLRGCAVPAASSVLPLATRWPVAAKSCVCV